MSNEKKPSEIILERLDQIDKELKTLRTTSTPEIEHQATQGHKTIDEVADCPNCKPKLIEKLKPDILKAERERIKSLKHPERCDGCGDVYDREEKETCPTCGKAH